MVVVASINLALIGIIHHLDKVYRTFPISHAAPLQAWVEVIV
jgi:hypothetical protein